MQRLLAACDALNGTWLRGFVSGQALALELADAERLDGTATKWAAGAR